MHPRNRHRERYDFERLCSCSASLTAFVTRNRFGELSIDFADGEAIKALNKALLSFFYNIHFWDLPQNYLCPPIPGRADYIHHVAELLECDDPIATPVKVLDIGVGANCIYPILGQREYGWQFVGVDIDPKALTNAQEIINNNEGLGAAIELRLQSSAQHIFQGIVQTGEQFALTLCNPPFHSSAYEAATGTQRKLNNLQGHKMHKPDRRRAPRRNFGGQANELWCDGGEAAFVRRMIRESVDFAHQSRWFTTLVSKESNLPGFYKTLKATSCSRVETINMAQGQKLSRILAWQF